MTRTEHAPTIATSTGSDLGVPASRAAEGALTGTGALPAMAAAPLDAPAAALRSGRDSSNAQRATLAQPERVTTTALVGHPATEILAEAARQESELVALGAHGRGAMERLRFGSVVEAVARWSPCSVQLLKRAVGAARATESRAGTDAGTT